MIAQSQVSPKIPVLVQGIDILEESVRSLDKELLNILLYDRTTRKIILWATSDYVSLGPEFGELCEITPALVTGEYADLIQPRITKSQSTRIERTRDKAEVFTPSWICNTQNNLIDRQWFGRDVVFNSENGNSWSVTDEPVESRMFSDGDVHEVLDRSGFDVHKFYDTDKDSEWYKVDLPRAIAAIGAVKDGCNALTAAEMAGVMISS